jgi:hypothetical protein
VHDDRVIAAALTAVLDECEWPLVQESVLFRRRDVAGNGSGGVVMFVILSYDSDGSMPLGGE